MKLVQLTSLLLLVVLYCATASAAVIIPTVPVGNAGNANDPATGNLYGGVNYNYNIGKTEVTNAQYVTFLNAVAKSDPYLLYNTLMGSGDLLGGIVRSGSSGSYTYQVKSPAASYAYDNKPVVYVDWGDAARFANWLNNGQPTGAEGPGTTETGAYTLNGKLFTILGVTRNPGATWFIPTENEWYKAAYYDPGSANYYNYPTGTNTAPNSNFPDSDTGNSASFNHLGVPYALTDAGAYVLSHSPYGTFDQGGNVTEWNETEVPTYLNHVMRGGSYRGSDNDLQASFRDPTGSALNSVGFRVASIPEPGCATLCLIGIFSLIARRRRK